MNHAHNLRAVVDLAIEDQVVSCGERAQASAHVWPGLLGLGLGLFGLLGLGLPGLLGLAGLLGLLVGVPVAPLHGVPLSAKSVGTGFEPFHEPLKPRETLPPAGMAGL